MNLIAFIVCSVAAVTSIAVGTPYPWLGVFNAFLAGINFAIWVSTIGSRA